MGMLQEKNIFTELKIKFILSLSLLTRPTSDHSLANRAPFIDMSDLFSISEISALDLNCFTLLHVSSCCCSFFCCFFFLSALRSVRNMSEFKEIRSISQSTLRCLPKLECRDFTFHSNSNIISGKLRVFWTLSVQTREILHLETKQKAEKLLMLSLNYVKRVVCVRAEISRLWSASFSFGVLPVCKKKQRLQCLFRVFAQKKAAKHIRKKSTVCPFLPVRRLCVWRTSLLSMIDRRLFDFLHTNDFTRACCWVFNTTHKYCVKLRNEKFTKQLTTSTICGKKKKAKLVR